MAEVEDAVLDPLQLAAVEIVPSGPLHGSLAAPASKSVTNRLLLMAALAHGTSRLHHVLDSDDTAVMMAGLRAFGAGVETVGDGTIEVTGTGGRLRQPEGVVSAGLSGTTLRWLAGAALLVEGTVVLDGEPPLRRRPIRPLLEALEQMGADIESDGGHPPLRIAAKGLQGGRIAVDAGESSQFATSLLLVAPYAAADVELEVAHLGAAGYVELTLAAMSRWGADARPVGPGSYFVSAGRHYQPRDETVEYDASSAAHLFALAMATGGSVAVTNAVPTAQPDAGIISVFKAMGAVVSGGGAATTLSRPGALTSADADVSSMPDQLPTLAALAALAEGTTRLEGVSVARGHETDRVAAVAAELRRLGAVVEEEADALVVQGGRLLTGTVVDTYDDHRMAMALASLGAAVPGVVIRHPDCVRKTYPHYWRDAAALGLGYRRPPPSLS